MNEETIGQRISKLRKLKGYTQDELAKLLNISRQAISKWEADISVPDMDNFYKLSKIFNISMEELVHGIKNINEKIVNENEIVKEDWEKEIEKQIPQKKNNIDELTFLKRLFFTKKSILNIMSTITLFLALIGFLIILFAPIYQIKYPNYDINFSAFDCLIQEYKVDYTYGYITIFGALLTIFSYGLSMFYYVFSANKIKKGDSKTFYKLSFLNIISITLTFIGMIILSIGCILLTPTKGAESTIYSYFGYFLLILACLTLPILLLVFKILIKKGKYSFFFQDVNDADKKQ